MRKYDSLPISKLVSDVAVDPVHVKELADSIKVSGPISPVLVREETSELIDGFHRVAAMKELGFDSVECIVTPCDQETFWDLRIMSATLHKAVTFARAVDWIDEAFSQSTWKERYSSAHSLFKQSSRREAPKDVQDWAETKAKKWGLSTGTIESWLNAKQSMAPELKEELKTGEGATVVPTDTYIEIARSLQSKPHLQKRVLDKAREEGLTSRSVREVSQAVRQAADDEEVKTILSQPISRSAEELTRAAKVEKILKEPVVEPPRSERERMFAGLLLEVYLDIQQMTHSVRRVNPEILQPLTPAQKSALLETTEDLIAELQQIVGYLSGEHLIEGKARLLEDIK